MTSLRQIESNRRNAAKSTGPVTELDKQRSRCNAVRHGLTAETVIQFLEDAEDYTAFELSVTANFDVQTAVERELVLRLAGLLWRLRRAPAIEAGLLQINCAEGLWADSDHGVPAEQNSNAAIAARFLVLNRTDGGAFERLNRYETGLWRQLGQLLVTLEFLRRNVSL